MNPAPDCPACFTDQIPRWAARSQDGDTWVCTDPACAHEWTEQPEPCPLAGW